MQKDELAEVIREAFRSAKVSGSVFVVPSLEQAQHVAAAVRAYANREDVVEHVARALAGPRADELAQAGNPIGEPCDYPAWMLCQLDARAAINAMLGGGDAE